MTKLTSFKNKSGKEIPVIEITEDGMQYPVRLEFRNAEFIMRRQKEILEILDKHSKAQER